MPGLYKIFDEILVNAADNKHNDASMSRIEVCIDQEEGTISVLNDGTPPFRNCTSVAPPPHYLTLAW